MRRTACRLRCRRYVDRVAGARAERFARNEAMFRSANERMLAREQRSDQGVLLLRCFCECWKRACDARLEIARAVYEDVRADSRRFVVLPGHEHPEIERVVERGPGYRVVEKFAEVAELVTELDPRRATSARRPSS